MAMINQTIFVYCQIVLNLNRIGKNMNIYNDISQNAKREHLGQTWRGLSARKYPQYCFDGDELHLTYLLMII